MENNMQDTFQKTLKEITPLYKSYNDHFNFATQAASDKAVALFLTLIEIINPDVVFETGTGFSTYVLKERAVEAGHFEDNDEWINRLGEWMGGLTHLSFDKFAAFCSGARAKNAVGFLDSSLGFREFVINCLTTVSETGVYLIDDMHLGDNPLDIKPLARRLCPKGRIYDTKSLTLDQWGRYSWLFVGDMIDHELQLSNNYFKEMFGEPICEH
jgi:hypothetical protein